MPRHMHGVLLAFSLLVSGCSPLIAPLGGGCSPEEESLSRKLAKSEILRLAPAGATGFDDYVTTPCQDDDNVGRIGTMFEFPGTTDQLRQYYRAELPSRGWTLSGEGPPFQSGQGLDFGRPELCFDSMSPPHVILAVYTATRAPASAPSGIPEEQSEQMSTELSDLGPEPNRLEFRFTMEGDLRCAEAMN
ncbi:hypothetical protein JOF56_005847 [Kibdelosporangium banguiense]|uniref:DUF3558 domain-containing protein n=1 Tax=Kibdelosporangium banguiense TaxID=1365924 RepID=A0ABS4TM08_9PSEU|nr:hypothetical protein [Kibdelosporangium banguiense]MBP2325462.1 hypothetical protein [Kibdelosporangium banguiense]